MSMASQDSRSVVLLGLMGSGKTTIGEAVARALSRPFSDSDRYLEERVAMSGRRIAEERGVVALHTLEADHLLEVLASAIPTVVAAAASVVERADCVDAIRHRAIGVWLDIDPVILAERIGRQGARLPSGQVPDHRRLLANPVVALTEQRATRRSGFLAAAQLVLTTGTVEAMSTEILAFLEEEPENDASGPGFDQSGPE